MRKRIIIIFILFDIVVIAVSLLLLCFRDKGEETLESSLSIPVEGLEEVYNATADELSEESFVSLNQEYEQLDKEYHLVLDYYSNEEGMERNIDIEYALDEAHEYLKIVKELNEKDITEADAKLIIESMEQAKESLDFVAESMGLVLN